MIKNSAFKTRRAPKVSRKRETFLRLLLLFHAGYRFRAAPFQCRLFHGRNARQNALAGSPRPAALKEKPSLLASAPGPERTVQQNSYTLSKDCDRCRTAGEPPMLGLAGKLPNIRPIMSSGFTLARADKTHKPAWSGRRDCPQAGIQSVNPPITMIRQGRPAEKRSEHG